MMPACSRTHLCPACRLKDPDRSLRERFDLSLKQPSIVIAVKLAQRCFVELVEDIAQLFFVGAPGGETTAVNLSQCPYQGVAVFAADFTVVIPVSMIQSRLFHGIFLLSDLGQAVALASQCRK
jgi:hypothetical protein